MPTGGNNRPTMQTDHNLPAAIILAAGTSNRMGNGRHKLLLPLGERPVLAHTIAATVASQARPIIVVLGYQAALVRSAIAPFIDDNEVISVENPHYLQGMSTSLHAGICALQSGEYPPTGQHRSNRPSAGHPQGMPLQWNERTSQADSHHCRGIP
ncbi:MAG: hypothetical protein E6J34_05655 [Chloroflexi bacterium]|nr:MAG: hypothetical protein E6J34_05655 [Chloroflexota bacterium]